MGTIKQMGVAETLFTRTQRRVLGLLFGDPENSYYANEIVRFSGTGIGATQRLLEQLAGAGLLVVTRHGNRKHYQANREAPVFDELRGIALKALDTTAPPAPALTGERTAAVAEPRGGYASSSQAPAHDAPEASADDALRIGLQLVVSRAALKALVHRYHVRRLAVFGSAARGELRADSDIDLLVEFEPGQAPSLWAQHAVREDFSQLFGGRPVDLASPEILRNPYRRRAIEHDLRVLHEAP
jgi:predicted nucleotidyltransferase